MTKTKHWITPDWPAPANIHAATTLRTGGVSLGAFGSLNLAGHVGDNPKQVERNRAAITAMLGLPTDPVWLAQIHGNQVVEAIKAPRPHQADASYTAESGVVCAIMTADCLPLLVCAGDGSKVAAIHAGWRGLLAGIVSNTLAVMPKNVLVWLGPAIGPDCFEVGAEVRTAFLEKSSAYAKAFRPQSDGKWLADIYALARIELAALGVYAVYGGNFCTVKEQARFYSYRRDKETGRMATLIWRS